MTFGTTLVLLWPVLLESGLQVAVRTKRQQTFPIFDLFLFSVNAILIYCF